MYDTTADGVPADERPAEVGVGVVGQAVRYGRVATETKGNEPTVEVHSDRAMRCLAVPLVVGAQVTGAIQLTAPELHRMLDGSLEVLQTLSSHAAAAIEAARLHSQTEELAQTDGLTGIVNRRRLDADLAAECERAARYQRPIALIMIDVDHFRGSTTRSATSAGDETLQELAEVARQEIRATDTVYRYGGEEFAVLTREDRSRAGDGARRAAALSDRVSLPRSRIRSPHHRLAGGRRAPPEHPSPVESLIASADAALELPKTSGRNRISGPDAAPLPQLLFARLMAGPASPTPAVARRLAANLLTVE